MTAWVQEAVVRGVGGWGGGGGGGGGAQGAPRNGNL